MRRGGATPVAVSTVPETPPSQPARDREEASLRLPPSPRARRMTRLVYGAFIVLLTTFVLSNIGQVVHVLYFEPEAANARAITNEPCKKSLEAVASGLENAVAAAAAARNADAAESAYRAKKTEITPHWSEAERSCASAKNGPEALAAMTRLDRAAEATARRRGEALAPVRREVDSFIR